MSIKPNDRTADNPILLLHAYLDRELDPVNSLAIERKIADDPLLAAERDRIIALREAIGANLPAEPAPETLRMRIERELRLRPQVSGPSWRALAASVALAVLVTGSSTWFLRNPPRNQSTEQAILDEHIRALMAPQPADVASTDSHTVKPWFNGRVPESPYVVDLTASGFPLIGGRIDVVNGRPVPTLVYKRRKHIISLIAIPAPAERESGLQASSDNGYNIMHWDTGGVSYWAVSDVSKPDLNEFVSQFRAH